LIEPQTQVTQSNQSSQTVVGGVEGWELGDT